MYEHNRSTCTGPQGRIGGKTEMKKEDLIHLHVEGTDVYLDNKLLHHIKEIKIESAVVTGTAELSIKMEVKYP